MEGIIEFRRTLVKRALDYYRLRDIPGMLGVLDTLEARLVDAEDVHERGKFDTAAAHIITMVAEAHLDDLDFENCYLMCQEAHDVLVASSRLFQSHNIKPYPRSMAWCGILTILADAKWKHREENMDRVIPAFKMIEMFTAICRRVCEETRKSKIGPLTANNRYHALLWAGIMLIKTSMRFHFGREGELREELANVYPDALEREDWPYYWDLLIAEEVFSSRPSKRRINHYYKERNVCVRQQFENKLDLAAYIDAAAKEKDYLHGCRF
ncbi:hypothetical protein JW859_02950 [bacterium]|nr:hypothetical protein [bacterium]